MVDNLRWTVSVLIELDPIQFISMQFWKSSQEDGYRFIEGTRVHRVDTVRPGPKVVQVHKSVIRWNIQWKTAFEQFANARSLHKRQTAFAFSSSALCRDITILPSVGTLYKLCIPNQHFIHNNLSFACFSHILSFLSSAAGHPIIQ